MVVERCRRTKRRQVGKKWEAVLRLVFVENPQTKCSVSVFHRTAGTRFRDSITHTSRGSSPSLFFSQPHGRDTPQPLRNSKKQSWLRLTDLPSASTSAPPTPASASGRMIGTSTLPDPFSRREKRRDYRRHVIARRAHAIASRSTPDRRDERALGTSRTTPFDVSFASIPPRSRRRRPGVDRLRRDDPSRKVATVAEASRGPSSGFFSATEPETDLTPPPVLLQR